MVRRVANQVHKQYARLARAGYFQQQPKEPAWYQAVLDHPPIPLPARATPTRTGYDLPPKQTDQFKLSTKPSKVKTPPIVYIEDEIRRQFFRDHPFEAFRERTLAEGGRIEDEHDIRGVAWIRLSQRGRNPSPEDAVRFAVSLHKHHGFPLSQAYATAVTQFRALRSEHHIATRVAAAEAEAYGAEFSLTETEKGFLKEEEYLKTWETSKSAERGFLEARKRWKAIADRRGNVGTWSRGEEYVRLWREGIRPNYVMSVAPQEAVIQEEKKADFRGLQQTVRGTVQVEQEMEQIRVPAQQ